ncbi:hypothetical protein DXA92_07600 [Agathobaculum butyriciproducens]|nr:hypothetical protein DXA94_12845 [Agathobaculum butyriciproducens]RGC61149.1 hypothetical protein DXA92_07600 [Agathobaculum butyriciproducens]
MKRLYGVCINEFDCSGDYPDTIVSHASKLVDSYEAAQKYCEQLCAEKCEELTKDTNDSEYRYDWKTDGHSYYVEAIWKDVKSNNFEVNNCFWYEIIEFDY